jgi:hypothetical protein
MSKRDSKHSIAEDFLNQIKWIINVFHHSLLQLAMNNGQVPAYWKELQYRGQPEEKPPKFRKHARSQKEIHPLNLNVAVEISIIAILILVAVFFLSPGALVPFTKICIFSLSILLLMSGLAKGINVWNKFLRADDLDEPKGADENQEEPMSKIDKHSMAEDFLQQVEQESQHPWYDGSTPLARYTPKWKYKRVFRKSKNISKESISGNLTWPLLILFTIGYLIYQIVILDF